MERDELRVELSIRRQREREREQKNKLARLDVLEGINTFETTLQNALLNTRSHQLKDAELIEATQVHGSDVVSDLIDCAVALKQQA